MTFPETLFVEVVKVVLTAALVAGAAAWFIEGYKQRQEARASLRATYTKFLKAQRRSREASLALARAGGREADTKLNEAATDGKVEFAEAYYELSLDADRALWLEVRALRDILDHLLDSARAGDMKESEELARSSRAARQNVQRELRRNLGHDPLQTRRALGQFDKRSKPRDDDAL